MIIIFLVFLPGVASDGGERRFNDIFDQIDFIDLSTTRITYKVNFSGRYEMWQRHEAHQMLGAWFGH